jgi:phenylalanyl-tRNA synthetase alpha chain
LEEDRTRRSDEAADLHPLEEMLLEHLVENGESTEKGILLESRLPDEGSYRRAAQWLLSRGLIRETGRSETAEVRLGPLGEELAATGTIPEVALLEKVRAGETDLRSIQEDETFDRGRWGSALGSLLRAGDIGRGPEGLSPESTGESVFHRFLDLVYRPLREGETVMLGDLPDDVAALVEERSPKRSKRKAELELHRSTRLTLKATGEGERVYRAAADVRTIGAVTPEVLRSGEWRDARFRRFRVDIPPSRIHTGSLHPYRQFLDRVRSKFVALGFTEMRGSLAESEFWNNDALFMPQFHPARDIHDVYYLEEGVGVEPPGEETFRRVASTHENGGDTGGRGWGYPFSREQALRAVMRSQGTALSARTLASGPEVPGKYFGMARCFRYDQVDATHLPDFFQIEGIVLGEGIGLTHLMGLLRLFAVEIAGAEDYRFLPAYFPFTEPSVEMHLRHPRLGWVEGGGAGLFRPEVYRPLGVEVPVIAWGLGLDRLAMLALGLDDIRDLVTPELSRLREMVIRPEELLRGREG